MDEVIGYYSMLHKKPLGKYHVQVCTNISCLLRGGEELYEHACEDARHRPQEVTADGLISLEEVECIGACSWAPAIQVNYDFHHNVTPEKLDKLLDDIAQVEAEGSIDDALQRTQSARNQSSDAALRASRTRRRSTRISRTTATRRS